MKEINAVIFDYGLTIGAEYYFNVEHPNIKNWFKIVQRIAFEDKEFNHKWMLGLKTTKDISKIIATETKVDENEVLDYLEKGCIKIKENVEVINLAKDLKKLNLPIGMVTVNFDIFNKIIIPNHGYDKIFDVIINSSDFKDIDKLNLWEIAFDKMNYNKKYKNCLLIEDSEYEVSKFKKMGAEVIVYNKNTNFKKELLNYNFKSCLTTAST